MRKWLIPSTVTKELVAGYELAENDQADELRRLAAAGDDHARRQLASWLSDRAGLEEAIEVIRPLADAGDDVAELWLARWLADCDRIEELRERAGTGYHASRELARLLADHDLLDELRDRVSAGGPHYALRVLADFGHKASRMHRPAPPGRPP